MIIEKNWLVFNDYELFLTILKTINQKEPFKILEVKKDENNNIKFWINFSKYIEGGIVCKSKDPMDTKYNSYKERSNIPFGKKRILFSSYEESDSFFILKNIIYVYF